MPTECPVCGADADHVRRERPDEGAAGSGGPSAPHTRIDVDELCAATDRRWDRICHRARLAEGGGTSVPVLVAYYHYLGEPEGGADAGG